MDDNNFKLCAVCIIEKGIDDFYNENRDCEACKIKRVLKRYLSNKEKILQQRRDKLTFFLRFGLESIGRQAKFKH